MTFRSSLAAFALALCLAGPAAAQEPKEYYVPLLTLGGYIDAVTVEEDFIPGVELVFFAEIGAEGKVEELRCVAKNPKGEAVFLSFPASSNDGGI